MLKHYCDACGKEITENRQVFTPSYHLIEPNDGLYVDRGLIPFPAGELNLTYA